MSPLSRSARLAVAALLLLLTAGCVEFEKQTAYFVFPKDRDEVDALLVYEGIRVDHANDKALKEAKKQLEEFTHEKQALLLGWPFILDMTPRPGDTADEKQFKELLAKHIAIKNGAFYTNADGKLCGYQTVTVRDASKLVAAVNGKISEAILADKGPAVNDKRTRELTLRAARDKHAWLKVEPGRISADLPMSRESSRQMKSDALGADLLGEIAKALEGKEPPSRAYVERLNSTVAFWADNPWSFEQRRERVVISLGVGDGEPIRLDNPPDNIPHDATKDAALADYAKTLPVKFRKGVTVDSLIEEFAKEYGGATPANK